MFQNLAVICTGHETEPLELIHHYALFPDTNLSANGFLLKELAAKEQVLTNCPYLLNKRRAEPGDTELKAVEAALSVLPHKPYVPAESPSGFLSAVVPDEPKRPPKAEAQRAVPPQMSGAAPERRKRRLKPLVAALASPMPEPHREGKRAAEPVAGASPQPKRRHRLFDPDDQ